MLLCIGWLPPDGMFQQDNNPKQGKMVKTTFWSPDLICSRFSYVRKNYQRFANSLAELEERCQKNSVGDELQEVQKCFRGYAKNWLAVIKAKVWHFFYLKKRRRKTYSTIRKGIQTWYTSFSIFPTIWLMTRNLHLSSHNQRCVLCALWNDV